MISLARLEPRDRVADLGSGDGRILFAAVSAGVAEAVGFEINPILVRWSRDRAVKRGQSDRVQIVEADFWNADLSSFDAVFIYQLPHVMSELEMKLRSELRPGARVVVHGAPFPAWEHVARDGRILLYRQA
jgi:SAM-dependent methyltransferase